MRMPTTRKGRTAAAIAGAIAVFMLIGGASDGGCGGNGAPSQNSSLQTESNSVGKKLIAAEPFPLSQMNDSAERANLREKLLRLNNPDKIGYVYELSQTGAVIAEYQIKGKVSSDDSQLLNAEDEITQGSVNSDGGNVVVPSIQDDGSFGGNTNGIFFFTTAGVLVMWNGFWQYSDAPLKLSTPPILTINANAGPSSTAGQLKGH